MKNTCYECGLIFGGYLTLIAPSEEENEEMHRDCCDAREKSWLRALVFIQLRSAGEGKLASNGCDSLATQTAGAQVDLLRRDLSDDCSSSWIPFRIVQLMIGS